MAVTWNSTKWQQKGVHHHVILRTLALLVRPPTLRRSSLPPRPSEAPFTNHCERRFVSVIFRLRPASGGELDGDKNSVGVSHIESGGSSRAKIWVTWPFTNEMTGAAATTVSKAPRYLIRPNMTATLARRAANVPNRFASTDTKEIFPHALHVTGVPLLPPM